MSTKISDKLAHRLPEIQAVVWPMDAFRDSQKWMKRSGFIPLRWSDLGPVMAVAAACAESGASECTITAAKAFKGAVTKKRLSRLASLGILTMREDVRGRRSVILYGLTDRSLGCVVALLDSYARRYGMDYLSQYRNRCKINKRAERARKKRAA